MHTDTEFICGIKDALDEKRGNLAQLVRIGTCADSPEILEEYIKLCQCDCGQSQCAIELYSDLFDLLMDTVCDALVKEYWRQYCLDHFYIPLQSLSSLSLSKTQHLELQRKRNELRVLGQYLFAK